MALWYVGTVGLKLCWTVFYDDFTVNFQTLFESWNNDKYSRRGPFRSLWHVSKAVEFGTQVRSLGLLVELGDVRKSFSVGHTQERKEAALPEVLREKKLEPKQAERLRGRMQWFEGYATLLAA